MCTKRAGALPQGDRGDQEAADSAGRQRAGGTDNGSGSRPGCYADANQIDCGGRGVGQGGAGELRDSDKDKGERDKSLGGKNNV